MEKEKKIHHGRAKGTPNKTTKVTRELINELLVGEYDRFKGELKNLKAHEFCKLYVDLIRYVTPTLKSVDVNESKAHDGGIAERIRQMAEGNDGKN